MTPKREDYLKLIFELGGDKQKVSNKQIVSGLDVSAASVSEMILKLVKEELVIHSPYQGVQLSESGLKKASTLIRKHRLWEVFLAEHLNYSWNEVHEEAELLEHVTSQTLTDRLDKYLNHPKFCPHGGVIPPDNEAVRELKQQPLSKFPIGKTIKIFRVLDEKELLNYLVTHDINIHEEYLIREIDLEKETITIENQEKKHVIDFKIASTIFVEEL